MKKRRILVTGGTGYIGAHTVVELINSGYEPIIVDNLSNSNISVLDGVNSIVGFKPLFEQVDCSDFEDFESVFSKYDNIEATIHFAAFKAVGESVEKPMLYYKNNLQSLLNLIELSLKYSVGSIVFSSSCTVYGQPDKDHLPVSESAPLQPAQSPYGKTKQMCEEILKDIAYANGDSIKVISLRYFNPIGAHPSSQIGELPLGIPQNLLPFVTQTAAGIRDIISVFGDDYNTPDGSCIRDYIYVCDLAKAHVASIQRLLNDREKMDGSIEFFNLGTGNGMSVLDILRIFMKANGLEVPYKIAPRRAGDVEQVWADPSKANEILGWSADTPIEDVMRSAWNWEKKIRGLK